MKAIFLSPAATLARTGFALAAALLFQSSADAATTMVDLAAAAGFSVLAGAGITNTGPTAIIGDVGTFPTASITGFGSVALTGVNHGADGSTQVAIIDLNTAYDDAAGRAVDVSLSAAFDLMGQVLTPGVYHGISSVFLTGAVTLDAQGDPNAVWVFQIGSTLITASNSMVILAGGAQAGNVFWQVGTSATLGTGTDFAGSILADASITLNTGATIDGRILAINGAVTLDSNAVIAPPVVPEPSTALLLVPAAGVLAVSRRRRASRPPQLP